MVIVWGLVSADHFQIGSNHTPAKPSISACRPLLEVSIQAQDSVQPTDPTFRASSEAWPCFKPAALFQLLSFFGPFSFFRQTHPFCALVIRQLLVGGRSTAGISKIDDGPPVL